MGFSPEIEIEIPNDLMDLQSLLRLDYTELPFFDTFHEQIVGSRDLFKFLFRWHRLHSKQIVLATLKFNAQGLAPHTLTRQYTIIVDSNFGFINYLSQQFWRPRLIVCACRAKLISTSPFGCGVYYRSRLQLHT